MSIMRILMAHTFHHHRGGDSTYCLSLTRQLEIRGHEVLPLAMRHPENQPSIWEPRFLGWTDLREKRSTLRKMGLVRRLVWSPKARRTCAELVEEYRPDIAHIQHVHRHITPSVLEPLNRAGIPVVWTVHDYELICPEGHLFAPDGPCTRCRGHRYWQSVRHRCKWQSRVPSAVAAFEKFVHRWKRVWERVDCFVCPSRFLADRLIEFGIPERKVVVLPNFVDVPAETGPWSPGRGWLYAGRLTVEKGVDTVIDAARRLPEYPLWICGTGPEAESLRRRAEDLEQVHFMGHLAPDRLRELMGRVGAVSVPSRWYENFPYAVLEAQAAGRPVVASRIGGIPEQIDDGRDGILVPADDPVALAGAIDGILSNPQQARMLGGAAADRVRERLGAEAHMEALVEVYHKALG